MGLVVTQIYGPFGPPDRSPNHKHLKPLEPAIGEWVAEFKIPPGHPEFGEEGESAVFSGTWRWMLKKNFMVINMKRQIGEKTLLSKECRQVKLGSYLAAFFAFSTFLNV
jgi:hypothetical protein